MVRVRFSRNPTLFFFSSRRRHTRCSRDWSSDVCSSDLRFLATVVRQEIAPHVGLAQHVTADESVRVRAPGVLDRKSTELQSQSNLVCRLLLEKKKKLNTELLLLAQHATANLRTATRAVLF